MVNEYLDKFLEVDFINLIKNKMNVIYYDCIKENWTRVEEKKFEYTNILEN